MAVNDTWYLVTAGHVLAGIDKSVKQGKKLDGFYLVDSWSGRCRSDVPVPLPFDSLDKESVGNNDDIDYGIIRLPNLIRDNLMANGVEAITKEQWINQPAVCEFYWLLGTPTELKAQQTVRQFSSSQPSMEDSVQLAAAMLRLEHVVDPPTELLKAHHRIYARFAEDTPQSRIPLSDIDGMSGGPLFGFKRIDGRLKYWIVGVQSGWLKGKRTIAACPFEVFAEFVFAYHAE